MKSKDWAALYWFATIERAGGWNPLACITGLSPRSCRLKEISRDGRVTALTVYGVLAPDELRFFKRIAGGTAEGNAFRPDFGDEWRYFFADSVG